MIVLDTNVLSELMRAQPDPAVVGWLDMQAARELFVTSITEAEILAGVALLPAGRRRDGIAAAATRVFDTLLGRRVLAFDREAAGAYAVIVADRRAAGRPSALADAMIAAIARSRGAAIATRNVRDFEGCGPVVVDPWSARAN